MAIRRLTLRLYPTIVQAAKMDAVRLSHQRLYNAALEERIGAYRRGIRISFLEQARSLTLIRADDEEMRSIVQRGQNMTLRRLDRAYQSFFRRVRAGQTPGFPRFQSNRRFRGWSLAADEGYRYKPKETADGRWFNGGLFLRDAGGMVKARGKARWNGGTVKQLDISKRAERWYASLAVDCEPIRQGGTKACGLDWGVTDYATVAYADGTTKMIANDRLFQAQQEEARDKQRESSKSLRGRRSNRAKVAHLRVARQHAKLAAQRKDRAHKQSAQLVAEHALIATEKLTIANMTRSAKGTAENPGRYVAQKAGLNREILDTAPGMLMHMLRYKAEEAGVVLEMLDTRKIKPSQTCPGCGVQAKKLLTERVHACGCGLVMSRDGAAALVMLQSSWYTNGRKSASGMPPEIKAIAPKKR